MGKMKNFDLFALKAKLDEEKYERNKNKSETTGEKLMKVIVVLIAALMFISAFSTFNLPVIAMYLLSALGIFAVVFRAYTVFKK